MKPETLLRLYPRAWRERYGDEFLALLQQTGVGWRQLIDVFAGASREWVRVFVRRRSLQPVALEVRRGLVFFSIAWVWTWLSAWMFGNPLRVQLSDVVPQLQGVGLFMSSALACNALERIAFRFVPGGRATSGELTSISAGAFFLVTVTVLAVNWVGFQSKGLIVGLFALPSGVTPFVMMGEFFGRPALGKRTSVHDVGLSA